MTTTYLDLSPAMRALLVDAARCQIDGLAYVIGHEHTRKALLRRGLAEEQDVTLTAGRRTVLTREGRHAAAQVLVEEARQR